LFNFLKRIVDDNDTDINPAHVVALLLTVGVLFWVTWIVIHTRTMPDLQGPAYLLGGSGAMNVAHKMEDIIASFKKP
jgi:hypothetical protein